MALFGKKKVEEKLETKPVTNAPVLNDIGAGRGLSHILRHARITEKATMHSADGVYTFDIASGATKRDVIQAVRALYKVTPRRVAVVTIPTKTKRNARTGKSGIRGGGKKAYVYLKRGDSIVIA